ncbi:MAG: T9SS type A sorting domain-containing protein [candidate division WOR-3 bacterium]|nr:T9SS type A sorting domain-containing protein [candidate division WOR-3 bacterium]
MALVEIHLVSSYPLYCAEGANRGFNFYGVSYTPDCYVDGDQVSAGYSAAITNRMNQPSPVTVTMWGMYMPNRGDGTIYAQFRNDSTASITARVYFVIVEDSCYYVAPNGDTWHNDVARDYLPNELGETVTVAPGDSVTFSRAFNVPLGWDQERCRIYAWIQEDTGDKEVFQAGIVELPDLVGAPSIPAIVQPFNCVRVPESQPTLVLNSVDPQGDDIAYRIMWDTDPNFANPESTTSSPQASGSNFYFTFPSPLTNNETYWWKVRASDPSGTGLWTPYTSAHSLTVLTGLPVNTCSWYQTKAEQFSGSLFFATTVAGDSIIIIPGGATLIDTFFFEDFETGTMPAGWTVVNGNSDPYEWTVGTTGDIGAYTPPDYGSAYAYYSDDDAGSGSTSYNEELISPAVAIPPAASDLDIVYGYGFRLYETGEKMRVKMRRFTGSSWTTWTDIALYTTSASGTATIDLTSYLPCDSVQFNWFYSDSTSASHWGWAGACDNVALRYTFQTSGNEGTVTSTPVVFDDLAGMYNRPNWGTAAWYKATAGDSIGIQVEYNNGSTWQLIPDGDLPGNATGFYSALAVDSVDLSGLNTTTYNALRLIAQFYRVPSESPGDPSLLAWELGNLASFIGIAENGSGLKAIQPVLRVVPTVSKNTVSISFMLGNGDMASSLSIYDASGRLVRSFDLKSVIGYPISVQWDGNDNSGRKTSAGIYFVKLETEQSAVVEKVVLLK